MRRHAGGRRCGARADASHPSGRPRPAVRSYYEGLPFGGLHAAGTKGGGSRPDGEPGGSRSRPEATAPGTEKPRWSAERRPRSWQQERGKTEDWCAARRSIPSVFRGAEGEDG
jgi:hypothetical protein